MSCSNESNRLLSRKTNPQLNWIVHTLGKSHSLNGLYLKKNVQNFPLSRKTVNVEHSTFVLQTCVGEFVCCFYCLHWPPHDREWRETGQPPRHDVELSSLTAPSHPIRKGLMWVHGPGYLAATGPSAGDGEATALWRRSLRLNAAARGKIKALIALCSSLWSLAFTESVVRVDWHSNGNGANLQFLPVYVKQRSQTDNQGFHFTVGIPWNFNTTVPAPIVLFIYVFQIYCKPWKN